MAWWKGKLFQDLIALASGEALSKIIGFFVFAYLARTLGTDGYGMVELAIALAVFFAMAIEFGYGSIGAREAAKNKATAELYCHRIVTARLLLTLVAIPMMGGIGYYTSHTTTASQLVWLFSFGLLAIPWQHNWLMQGLEKMNLVALGQVVRMLVFALGVFMFIHSMEDILTVGIVELFAAGSMAVCYLLMQIKYVGKPRFDFNLPELFLLSKNAISVGLSNVVWTLNQYIPVILISTFNTTTQLALFASVHRVTASLVGFSLLYHFNLFPSVAKKIDTSPEAFQVLAKASTHFTAWGGTAIALFISLLAEEIAVLIFGESFREAGNSLAIIIWVLPVTLLSGHSRWALIASNRQRCVLYAQSGSSIITIIFCLLLIPAYNSVGASIAMLLAALTVWCIAYFYARHYVCKIPFFGVLVKPLLFAGLSTLLANQFPGALSGTLAAICSYLLLTLIFDRSLLHSITTIANIKDYHSDRTINIEMLESNKILFFTLSGLLAGCGLFIPSTEMALWLDPEVGGEYLNQHSLGCTFLRGLLVIDGLILFWLGWKHHLDIQQEGGRLWQPRAQSIENKHLYASLLAAVSIVALITHSIGINSGLWIDEIFTVVNYLRLDLGQILSRFDSDNQHMLYSALAQICVSLFGETPFAVRLPALVFGLGSIIATASLGRYIFGYKIGIIAAALLTVSYHHVWFSQNARGYTILLFGAIVATECFLRGLESKQWRYWIAYAGVISLAAWAHLTGVFIALGHAVAFLGLVALKYRKPAPTNLIWQPVAGFFLSAWFTIHCYAIPLPQIIDFFSKSAVNASSSPVEWSNPLWLITEVFRNFGINVAMGWLGLLMFGVIGLFALFYCMKRDGLFVSVSLLPAILLGVVMLALGRNLWPRMFFSEFGFIIILAVIVAMALGQTLCSWIKKPMQLLSYAPLALLIIFFVWTLPKIYQHPKQDFVAARDYIKQEIATNDAVVGIHMAGRMYDIYYAPGEWPEVGSIEELDEHKSKDGYTWVVYTLPSFLKTAFPALFTKLETDYEQMKSFPGTLGDGTIFVLRSKP